MVLIEPDGGKRMQTIEMLGGRFWYMTPVSETDRPILGMVVGNHHALMIDAGNSEAHAQFFLEELAKKEVPGPSMVVLTHWHWDHILGLSALPGIVSISSKQTKVEMEKLQSLSWSDEALDERVKKGTEIEFCATAIKKEFPVHRNITVKMPVLTFENRLELDLGGVTCILDHVGGDHASDSVVIYIKEEKILFLGDSLYPDIFSAKNNYTVRGTIALLDRLESFDAETYILSHWKPISRAEFVKEAATLRTIAKYTVDFNGDKGCILEEYRKKAGRELTVDELSTIEEFINGYEMELNVND